MGNLLPGLLLAFSSTAISELGDRSFITASALSLRHDALIVFAATLCALCLQSVFSVALGASIKTFAHTLILDVCTEVAAGSLYLVFAYQHFAYLRKPTSVREEVVEIERDCPLHETPLLEEDGEVIDHAKLVPSRASLFGRVFVLIYLAELGDTSMIVTAALATRADPLAVIVGACLANGIVNGFGVWLGARALRALEDWVVNLGAGLIFASFGLTFIGHAAYRVCVR